jgi:hypothetical protein
LEFGAWDLGFYGFIEPYSSTGLESTLKFACPHPSILLTIKSTEFLNYSLFTIHYSFQAEFAISQMK